MGTTWNTPKQTTGTIEAVNAELRGVQLASNDGAIRTVDISGEDNAVLGRQKGIAEWAGVSVRTVQYWFSMPGAVTRPCVRLNDSIILDKDGVTTGPGMVGRRVYDLHPQSLRYFPALEPLRRRMFLAALVGGELRRDPVFSGTERVAVILNFSTVVGAVNQGLKIWNGEVSRYAQFAWTSMWVEPGFIVDSSGVTRQFWEFHHEYNEKKTADVYQEQETDIYGAETGETMDDVEQYDDLY